MLLKSKKKQAPIIRFKLASDAHEQVKKLAKKNGLEINAQARMLLLEKLEELTQKKG